MKSFLRFFLLTIFRTLQIFLIPIFVIIALYSRYFVRNKIDVGIGPHPLINNIYHKQALLRKGYTVETFVINTYFITQKFDVIFDSSSFLKKAFNIFLMFCYVLTRYRAVYIYFNGILPSSGEFSSHLLLRLEPLLLNLANIKTILMPYGSDVQDMLRCPNLLFRNAISLDYPKFQKDSRHSVIQNIDRWTNSASHIIAGCDWVWYLYHWDTLLSGHFAVDTDKLQPKPFPCVKENQTIKILHAPNHNAIKGSKHYIKAVDELKQEGYNVELILVQKLPNDELLKIMSDCHIVADQLIIGWYAMTAIEAMAYGKVVLCNLDQSLLDLYIEHGIFEPDEMPIVNCNFKNIKSILKHLLDYPDEMEKIGQKSRLFAENHHSLDVIGDVFDRINRSVGI
jgi:glycosyltransferase involved in cell wall biosynthesis